MYCDLNTKVVPRQVHNLQVQLILKAIPRLFCHPRCHLGRRSQEGMPKTRSIHRLHSLQMLFFLISRQFPEKYSNVYWVSRKHTKGTAFLFRVTVGNWCPGELCSGKFLVLSVISTNSGIAYRGILDHLTKTRQNKLELNFNYFQKISDFSLSGNKTSNQTEFRTFFRLIPERFSWSLSILSFVNWRHVNFLSTPEP